MCIFVHAKDRHRTIANRDFDMTAYRTALSLAASTLAFAAAQWRLNRGREVTE